MDALVHSDAAALAVILAPMLVALAVFLRMLR